MNIVDLFSGAGGLTFGFYYKLKEGKFVRNEKNNFIFANEFDPHAVKAYRLNYRDVNMIEGDIRNITDEKIIELAGNTSIDLVIGGPPCQSFSTVGQRRYDEKAKLFWEYLRILKLLKPKMFLFENVKGILSMREIFYKTDENDKIIVKEKIIGNTEYRKYTSYIPEEDHKGEKVLDIIKQKFEELGYSIKVQLVNAVDFGVPQNRERVLILGIRSDLDLNFEQFTIPNQPHITIKEAISDLPTVREGDRIDYYTSEPITDYQSLMRGENVYLRDHFCGTYGDKIRTVIQNVAQGEGRNHFNKLVDAGIIDKKYYLTSGFANTYGRLVEDLPSTTITNNLATPSGLRCIHYSQNRALTPREGARIQSFPDWFQFEGSRTDITKQIGNAVPPLLSLEIATQIDALLRR